MMEVQDILRILQRYFDGESTEAEERQLEIYFQSGEVAEELVEYTDFFGGISELANTAEDTEIEEQVMDYILEHEHKEKNKYRSMWKTVTGIAASIIIILGGFLLYQEQQKPFDDTFDDPDEAYAYATETLQFISGKYNTGLAPLADFDKLNKGRKSLKKGTAPVVEFFEGLEKMEREQPQSQIVKVDSM